MNPLRPAEIIKKFKWQSGFTLIEIMVVIALMCAVSAIAITNYMKWFPKYRLKGAARELYANMQKAKRLAITQNSSIRIRFDDTVTPGRFYFDDDNDSTIDANETVINFSEYPSGIDFGSGAAVSDWNTPANAINQIDFITFNNDLVTFNNRGTSNGGTVFIDNSYNTECFAVTVTTTGSLRLRYFNGTAWQ